MGITKGKLVFDTGAILDDNDNTGAFLRANDGTLVTTTTDGAKKRIDVSAGAEKLDGDAYVAGDRGNFVLAVDPNGDYAPFRVNAAGELLVDVQVVSGSDKAEDSVHASGDIGTYVLNVREDVLATSTSATGDYQSFKSDSLGALWVHASASESANLAISFQAVSVSTTATAIPATPLANRKKLQIQNLSNKDLYIGDSAVTTANGIELPAGADIVLEVGPGLLYYAITSAGTADVRIHEIA